MHPPHHTSTHAAATQVAGFYVKVVRAMAETDAPTMLSDASNSSTSSNSLTSIFFFFFVKKLLNFNFIV